MLLVSCQNDNKLLIIEQQKEAKSLYKQIKKNLLKEKIIMVCSCQDLESWKTIITQVL